MRLERFRIDTADFVVRECVYSGGTRLPRHAHDYGNITVVISGEIDEAAARGAHHGRSGSVVLKPPGVEHENVINGRGVRTLTIEVKQSDALAQRSWSWFEELDVVRRAIALRAAVVDRAGIEERAHALVETVLVPRARDTNAPTWFAHVKQVIEKRYDEPMRFDRLASEVGLHPVYMSRAFRLHAGTSMQEFLRAQRVRAARHLLASSNRSTAAVASLSGFTDASHLCHAFTDLLGVTPKVYRRIVREV